MEFLPKKGKMICVTFFWGFHTDLCVTMWHCARLGKVEANKNGAHCPPGRVRETEVTFLCSEIRKLRKSLKLRTG